MDHNAGSRVPSLYQTTRSIVIRSRCLQNILGITWKNRFHFQHKEIFIKAGLTGVEAMIIISALFPGYGEVIRMP